MPDSLNDSEALLTQTIQELRRLEPALLDLCKEIDGLKDEDLWKEIDGLKDETVEFLEGALDAMALAQGRLDHARARIRAKAS